MTDALSRSNRKRAARMLRHSRPRSRLVDGIPGATKQAVSSMDPQSLAIVSAFMAIMVMIAMMGYLVPPLSSYVRTPMIMTTIAVQVILAFAISQTVYAEAETRSDETYR